MMNGPTQQCQYRLMKVTNLKQLALEFVVIFLGVSASFGVTSFSQIRFEKAEENRLLKALALKSRQSEYTRRGPHETFQMTSRSILNY